MVKDERAGLPSASAMPRIVLCPGSVALEAQVPKDEASKSDEAQEGDAIHAAIENESDDDLDEQGKNIAARLRQMEKDALETWLAEIHADAAAAPIPLRECRHWIHDRKDLRPLASAKLDVYYLMGTHALAIDVKTGYLDVAPARVNIQMRTQALCLWHEYDYLTHIRVATAQFRFRGKFTASDYNVDDLKRAEQELLFNLWRAEQPEAPRIPSPEACRYCRAKSICPEAKAAALLPVVPMPRADVAKKDLPAIVRSMDLQTKAFLRARKTMIENILEAVSADLKKNYTPEELASVGLQLVPSGGVRALPDVQKLWEVLYAVGVTEQEFRSVLKATYGAAQAMLAERCKKDDTTITDTVAKERADKILEAAVVKVPRESSLKSL